MTLPKFLHIRPFFLVLLGHLLIMPRARADPMQPSDPLPILILGTGSQLDTTNARQQIRIVLPAPGERLVLMNSWSHGTNVLASHAEFFNSIILLSNVWAYGSSALSEEAFWQEQGVTNTPLKIAIPGEAGYYLVVANTRVLPFVERSEPSTRKGIWAWPKLPVKVNGSTGKSADISRCEIVSLEASAIKLHGWLAPVGIRQSWRLSVKSGLLCLELTVSPEPDY